MAKRLQLTEKVTPIGVGTEVKRLRTTYFTIQNFMNKQNEFLIYKRSQNLSPRSMYDYDRSFLYLNNYINEVYSDKQIRYDITLIRGYISYMLEKVSPNTVNIRIRYLKVYLQFLEQEGYVKERINERVKKVREVKNEKQPLTNSDIKKLLKVINMKSYAGLRDYTLVLLMLSVGTRINGTINIRVKNINLKEKYIVINAETAKNRTQRVVPLNSKLIVYLKKLIEISNDVGSEYVFLSSVSHDKVNLSHIKGQLIDYGKKAGLDKSSSAHKLRHTAITNLIKNGSNPLDVKSIAGHSSLEITMGYYHNNLKDLQKCIAKDTLSDI
ncbi:tyrosine-type recombinase/integrase [Clostridium kluyveri]|uniref:tyrosine-type recombinase/integrase n=1 Tax=Clostridium kluyveri TaxID=1534 RepID=UPI00224561CC|nr:tyrosine-type recombinase/integrase [Clostridium kluyveri]UZQ52009.1 site-specific integrase [Clostridium kluyveri]